MKICASKLALCTRYKGLVGLWGDDAEHWQCSMEALGTGICQTIPGTTSRYPILPEIPGTNDNGGHMFWE